MEPVFQSARLLQVPKVWNSIRYAISSDWISITFVTVNLLSTAAVENNFVCLVVTCCITFQSLQQQETL